MSSFICEHCSTPIIDSPRGYVTGCVHYPVEPLSMSMFASRKDYEEALKKRARERKERKKV